MIPYTNLIFSDDRKEGNPKAILTYEWENTKLADLQHTYVPEEFRGKGVAKLLAKVQKVYINYLMFM